MDIEVKIWVSDEKEFYMARVEEDLKGKITVSITGNFPKRNYKILYGKLENGRNIILINPYWYSSNMTKIEYSVSYLIYHKHLNETETFNEMFIECQNINDLGLSFTKQDRRTECEKEKKFTSLLNNEFEIIFTTKIKEIISETSVTYKRKSLIKINSGIGLSVLQWIDKLNLIENYFTLVFDLIVSTIKMYNEEIEVNFKNVDSEYKKITPSLRACVTKKKKKIKIYG